MCGIAGFCNFNKDYLSQSKEWHDVLDNMKNILRHRGPDDNGVYLSHNTGLSHARLSIIDLANGKQPMTRCVGDNKYTIVYNGELYNTKELRNDLETKGWSFKTTCDTEVILVGFMEYGPDFVKTMNGIFAFAIWDEKNKNLLLFRDRLGIKPLFYTIQSNTLIFGSELKAIFQYPGIEAKIDRKGLCEILAIGPGRTYGCGVFKDFNEVLPGFYNLFQPDGFKQIQYWKLISQPHTDSYKETLEKTSFLVTDSIKRQMVSDIPICTFLSGGVDSSIITAVCANELAKKGEQLNTFSFDFVDNDKYFKASSFQPSIDRPYVDIMVNQFNTNHIYLECSNNKLADYLYDAVDARDLPCMADVESSLIYFCSKVVDFDKVALTGECADEIFGGYPWFHKTESFEQNAFPWSLSLEPRKVLLKDDLMKQLNMEEYVLETYEKSINETPILEGEDKIEKRRREIAYLNIKWFMSTLLDRMDRTSMHSGLEARVPLADHRILEYVWNVPWNIKCKNGEVKHLLRESVKGLLPEEILRRRKSPYPKTYHPEYEDMLGRKLLSILEDKSAPINSIIDKDKLIKFINTPSDYGKPWYGQLMAGPQMLAYMLQINYWLEKYKIEIDL